MTTVPILTLTVILFAFVVIIAMMIRKSMNSTEELREELSQGYDPDQQERHYRQRVRALKRRAVVALVVTSITLAPILFDLSFLEWLLILLAAAGLPTILYIIDQTVTEQQENEKVQRSLYEPPQIEVIDSLESYNSFVGRENLNEKGIVTEAMYWSQLIQDIHDGKRDVAIDTEFLDGKDVPAEVRGRVEQMRFVLQTGREHESNPTYSRFYRRVSGWALVICALVGLVSIMLPKCS
jgi:hypothetical protein